MEANACLASATRNASNLSQYDNITMATDDMAPSEDLRKLQELNEVLSFSISNVAMPVVFSVGVLGNIMNLIVLAQKRFRKGLNHIERSTLTGLIFLAVSDGMFCLVGLPGTLLANKSPSIMPSTLAGLYYGIYKSGLFNIFLFASTWMIVSVSLERYLALCHPFTARWLIRIDRSVLAHLGILVVAVVLNLPLFFRLQIVASSCDLDGECLPCHVTVPTEFYRNNQALYNAHHILWAAIGTALPFLILLASNARIVYAVCRASKMAPPLTDSHEQKQASVTSRITVTLIAMVITFLVLVGPSMVLTFLSAVSTRSADGKSHYAYLIALLIANFCQALKFATNFVLYCATNRHFRDSVGNAIFCRSSHGKPSTMTPNKYKLVEIQAN